MSIESEPAWVPERAAEPARSHTVLVVDDDDGVRLLMEAVLTDSGYHVLTADDAEAAFDVAARHEGEIELLVTDVRMPGMSGPALAAQLRTSYVGLRVLFVSGLPDQAALRECGRTDDVELLHKPFSPAEMTARVAGLFRASQPY